MFLWSEHSSQLTLRMLLMGISVKVPVGTTATAGAASGVNAGAAGAAAGAWWYENRQYILTIHFIFTVPNIAQSGVKKVLLKIRTYRTGFRWNETVNIFPGDSSIRSSSYGYTRSIQYKSHRNNTSTLIINKLK